MKQSKRILSFLFLAVMGTICGLAIGIMPIFGALLGFASYLPVVFPSGILGENAIGITELEAENRILAKLEDKIKKALTEYNQDRINENGLQLRLAPIEKKLAELAENGVNKDAISKFQESFDALSLEVSSIKDVRENPMDNTSKEFRLAVAKAAEELKSKREGFVGVKTLSSMTFLDNVTGQIPQANREPGITSLVRQQFTVRNGANVFGIAGNYAEWVEQRNITGAATATAEGAAKPQIEWDYVVSGTKVEKIPAYIKISNEMLSDVDGMMNEINSNLAYQVELAEEGYLFTGSGATPQINGLDKYDTEIDLAGLAGSVLHPNKIDVLAAGITQIRVNGKGELRANRIFMNPLDIYKLIADTKDSTLNYVNTNWIQVLANPNPGGLPSMFVLGVPIVESDNVSAGYFYCCDMTKFNIRDKQAITIEMGYDSDDFTKNMVTVRAEKRLATYVKANHTEAIIKDTFANALVFLETGS